MTTHHPLLVDLGTNQRNHTRFYKDTQFSDSSFEKSYYLADLRAIHRAEFDSLMYQTVAKLFRALTSYEDDLLAIS